MARRERTTGLPRPRPRPGRTAGRQFAGINWHEGHARLAILGGAGVLLLLVLGLIGYRWYDTTFAKPNKTILTVGDQNFSLRYYSDRLYQFVQANQQQGSSSLALAEQQLLTKLEDEALTIQLARDKGISLSSDDITRAIAEELGVPVGGTGSSFDTLYRQRLKTTKMSDTNYRKLTEASLANQKLLDMFKGEVGEKGEQVTLRAVMTSTEDDANKALSEIKGGQDMGTVAQTESTDLQSRQNDGVMLPESPLLIPQPIQDAIKDKQPGSELFGPIQVQNNWWVFRLEKRDPQADYSDAQKGQLAQLKLDDALKQQRAATTIKRDISGADMNWAVDHAGK